MNATKITAEARQIVSDSRNDGSSFHRDVDSGVDGPVLVFGTTLRPSFRSLMREEDDSTDLSQRWIDNRLIRRLRWSQLVDNPVEPFVRRPAPDQHCIRILCEH